MNNRKYIKAGLISIAAVVITTIIIKLIDFIFNITIPNENFIIGWIGASVYYNMVIKQNTKEIFASTTSITTDMNDIKKHMEDYEELKKKYELLKFDMNKSEELVKKYKDDVEHIKSKYDNLKSEMIVQKNIKY